MENKAARCANMFPQPPRFREARNRQIKTTAPRGPVKVEPSRTPPNLFQRQKQEETMPVILLWVGIPVLVLGGGYAIVHMMH
jgi:hypothetical protein